MRIRTTTTVAAGLMFLATIACRGWQPGAEPKADTAGTRSAATAQRVAEVTVARPTRNAVSTYTEVPGTFMPYDETTISAEATGPIDDIRVEEGTRVTKGQTLVVQDTTKAALAVRQAEAMLAQARASLARASADLERKRLLLNDKTIPQNQFDTYKAQHDGAAAAVDGADTTLALARRQLEDLTTVAPYAGVIREKRVSLGTYVRPGDAMIVLMRTDPLKLQFELPEKYAMRIRDGLEVTATIAASPGQTFSGKVRTVFPALAVQSRSARVEAIVANANYQLKPGFFATVHVPLSGLPSSMAIPRAALVRREGTDNVFVVRAGDRAELVRVQTGVETADLIEIITGLDETDPIVVEGAQTLEHGDNVKVRS